MKVISFKVDDELLEMIDYQAGKKGLSRSELIRRAVLAYIMSSNDRPYVSRRIKIYS